MESLSRKKKDIGIHSHPVDSEGIPAVSVFACFIVL